MTIRHFEIFQTVCALGSITAAAGQLNMTQPAVSTAVRELESFYGTPLFERRNRRIYLTEAGGALLQYTGTILTQYQESVRALREESGHPLCRFGVNVTIGETRLAQLAAAVRAAVPGVVLQLYVENSAAIERRLRENTIDFAVADREFDSRRDEIRRIGRENMAVAAAPGAPARLSVAALAAKPLLLRETGSGSRAAVDAVFERHGCTPVPAAESVSTLALLQLAESGAGYAVLPEAVLQGALARGTLTAVAVTDDVFARSYYLVCRKNKYRTPAMRAAMEAISACAVWQAAAR